MPCEILIAAEHKNHSMRGYPKNVKDLPCTWGKLESPPGYVIFRVSDASTNQFEYLMQQWKRGFVGEVLQNSVAGFQAKFEVDPACVSASGANSDLRPGLKDFLVWIGGVIISHDYFSATVEVPKLISLIALRKKYSQFVEVPDDMLHARVLKHTITDIFKEMVDHRFHYFADADVDYALKQPGGIVEMTRAQVLSKVKSKLDL